MIYYHAGYKYQLYRHYSILLTGLNPTTNYGNDYFSITTDGYLTVKRGYAWDGPSGPTIDTKNFMRGSLIHDVLYQLIGLRILPIEDRKRADEILRELCREDGMTAVRAWWVYQAVRVAGGGPALRPDPPPQSAGKC